VTPDVTALRRFRAPAWRALLFAAIFAACAGHSYAQAPPGPLPAAPPADPSEVMPAPPPRHASPPRNPIGRHPNIAGLWVINRDDSDDARRKLREAEGYPNPSNRRQNGPLGGNGPYGNGPYGGGPNGPGGNGPYGGNNPNGRGGQNNNDSGQDPSTELTKLTITQTASAAKVLGASDQVLGQYTAPQTDTSSGPPAYPPVSSTSGSSSSTSASGSSGSSNSKNAPQITASWQGDAFVVVEQDNTGQRWKTTRRFELSQDKSQLQVTNTIEGAKLKKTLMFVLAYDLATIQPDQ
jgi:hypothetical protein